MEDMIVLPSWEECRSLQEVGAATALQKFIYHNEPQGQVDSTMFRRQLIGVLREIVGTPNRPEYSDPYEDIGTPLNPCRCGYERSVTLVPHGYCSHQVACRYCGYRGIPASTPDEAIRLWNDPRFEAQPTWFPRRCQLTMFHVVNDQWRVGYRLENAEYVPAHTSLYPFDEAVERCYREFEDRFLANHQGGIVPWRTRHNGSLPGGLCCLGAAGRYCHEHDPESYQQQSNGDWELK